MNLSEPVMAAMIGATATVCTAMFQLVVNWRKAAQDKPRARGGLRSLLWMLTLMTAAAVGGFAYAEYRAQGTRGEARAAARRVPARAERAVCFDGAPGNAAPGAAGGAESCGGTTARARWGCCSS